MKTPPIVSPEEWRNARSANGEDPSDWQAFRDHLSAIGAPDPGGPPDDWA